MSLLARTFLASCVAAALATLAFTAWMGEGTGAMLFGVWAAAPYGIVAIVGYAFREHVAPMAVLFLALVGLAVFAAIVYYDAFYVTLDPQGGLVLLFVPIVQIAGAIAASVVAAIAWWIQRKTARAGTDPRSTIGP